MKDMDEEREIKLQNWFYRSEGRETKYGVINAHPFISPFISLISLSLKSLWFALLIWRTDFTPEKSASPYHRRRHNI